MGERLAREADAIYKAKVEQGEAWHAAFRQGGVTTEEVVPMLAEAIGALREMILFLAREVDDPAPY